MNKWIRLGRAVGIAAAVMAIGVLGYVLLGFSLLDAVYQTVTTVFTVGFREVQPLDATGKIFTIGLIVVGVATALYTASIVVELVVEGHVQDLLGRRRMTNEIERMTGHLIVCGWGRVGRTIASFVEKSGRDLVVVERDPDRARRCPYPMIEGDATDDAVLLSAGIDRASSIIAALDGDAENLFLVTSARALTPGIFVVSRVRAEQNEAKLLRAGADRVVNPQQIGGARMAAFVVQPHVAEFMDVVMHDGSLEFRLAECQVPESSPLVGRSLREAHLRDRTGALVMAVRDSLGEFATNPGPEYRVCSGDVLIAVGTQPQLDALTAFVVSGFEAPGK